MNIFGTNSNESENAFIIYVHDYDIYNDDDGEYGIGRARASLALITVFL